MVRLAARHGAIERGARRRRVVAAGSSVLLHGLIAWLALGTLKGGMITDDAGGAAGDTGAVEVSLEGIRGPTRAGDTDLADTALASMFRRVEAAQSTLPEGEHERRQTTDLQEIVNAMDRVRAARNALAGDDGQGAMDRGGKAAASQSAATPRASAGDLLWGQIKPCWDQLPSRSTVPVTLLITLDAGGRIAKPPQIVRPVGSALDEMRLISEARALAAVAACTPYNIGGAKGPNGAFKLRLGE